jgi:hypothetical protein
MIAMGDATTSEGDHMGLSKEQGTPQLCQTLQPMYHITPHLHQLSPVSFLLSGLCIIVHYSILSNVHTENCLVILCTAHVPEIVPEIPGFCPAASGSGL